MSDNMIQAFWATVVTIIACTLICGITYYNVNESQLLANKQIEYAKQGLHQKIELNGVILWVKP